MSVVLEVEQAIEITRDFLAFGNDLPDKGQGLGMVLTSEASPQAVAASGVGGSNTGEYRQCCGDAREVDVILVIGRFNLFTKDEVSNDQE